MLNRTVLKAQSMSLAATNCNHDTIVTKSDDTICEKCGIVLNPEYEYESPFEGNSVTNLYERHSVGSRDMVPKTGETERIRAYFHNNIDVHDSKNKIRSLSCFSNCCQKLGLDRAASEYSLILFRRGKRAFGPRQHPIVAVWAIYKACQMYGIPISDHEIKTTVKFEFQRKYLPDMTRILYMLMSKNVTAPEAADNEEYHFRLALRKIVGGMTFGESEYAEKIANAWNLYKNVYNDGSCKARSRQSIMQAFGVRK